MANAEGRKRCCLQWDIYNPFLPRTDLEATFYYEYPWKMIFVPKNRGINSWEFAITFAHNIKFKTPPNLVVARNVEITVLIYGVDSVIRKRPGDIQFSSDNLYWHSFQETVVMPEIRLVHKLCIKLEFALTRENIGVTTFHYNHNDLLQLSKDMRKVLNEEENTDFILRSADNLGSFNVHSYIINSRWSNFIEEHRNQAMDAVQTNISNNLLSNIITYMYCGDFPIILPFLTVPEYGTELCQVVHRYRLEHLYKVLVKNDLKQHRVTINAMYMASRLFPLRIVENRFINYTTYTRMVNFGDQTEITLRIQVRNEAGNWLSYSLQSLCESRVYVEVNLEVVKKEERAPETTFPFHGQDQAMEPHQTVESGPVLFLGCPETFGNSNATNIKYSIRCFLNVSRGRRLELLKSVDSMEYRDAKERYEVLSDHMRHLFKKKREMMARMIVSSGNRKKDVNIRIHKEIFKARVPKNIMEDPLPDRVICNLGPISLPFVVEYIYTGKVLFFPALCIQDITRFAEQTDMITLKELVKSFIAGKKKEESN